MLALMLQPEAAGGPVEKIALTLPPDVHVEDAPAGRTISDLLEIGRAHV